jgi:PAS domain S-box-containing protein
VLKHKTEGMVATEAWRAEGALASDLMQETMLYEVWDKAPALVFVADADMRYLAVNATACELLGYTREEVLGLTVPDIAIQPGSAELYETLIVDRAQMGFTHLRTKGGNILPFRYAAKEGQVAGLPCYIAVGFIADEPPPA